MQKSETFITDTVLVTRWPQSRRKSIEIGSVEAVHKCLYQMKTLYYEIKKNIIVGTIISYFMYLSLNILKKQDRVVLCSVKRICTLVAGYRVFNNNPDSKVHGANMGRTWVLTAPDGPHVGPTNLAIRDKSMF